MSITIESNDDVSIVISEDVIIGIANSAMHDIKGIASIANRVSTTDFRDIFAKKPFSKGILVEMVDDSVELTISLNLNAGVKIPEVAEQVQSAVKTAVESMTSLTVSKINVSVLGIVVKKETAAK
ncbi:MAG: Asp23/Gls24 family envelope stress response protein [Clostridia bacterium]